MNVQIAVHANDKLTSLIYCAPNNHIMIRTQALSCNISLSIQLIIHYLLYWKHDQCIQDAICDMIYSMEAKVGISKVEIQVKIGCLGEFWQK